MSPIYAYLFATSLFMFSSTHQPHPRSASPGGTSAPRGIPTPIFSSSRHQVDNNSSPPPKTGGIHNFLASVDPHTLPVASMTSPSLFTVGLHQDETTNQPTFKQHDADVITSGNEDSKNAHHSDTSSFHSISIPFNAHKTPQSDEMLKSVHSSMPSDDVELSEHHSRLIEYHHEDEPPDPLQQQVDCDTNLIPSDGKIKLVFRMVNPVFENGGELDMSIWLSNIVQDDDHSRFVAGDPNNVLDPSPPARPDHPHGHNDPPPLGFSPTCSFSTP